jgi:predicted N-formylglutamate amidohydrolase
VPILITCEHGGNRIPARYRPLFRKHGSLLQSHRGFDPGALAIARDFAAAFQAELVYSTTSRLLVELNRSPNHPRLFSEVALALAPEERQRVLERYYFPYREWVESQVRLSVEKHERVVHVSCHSFTPTLHGIERHADIGLLYDPRRRREAEFCATWRRELKRADARLVVRRNYPYRGYDDGLTTFLRKRYPDRAYAGIELEVNQKYPLQKPQRWRELRKLLLQTLARSL